jgi:hypothetical protein
MKPAAAVAGGAVRPAPSPGQRRLTSLILIALVVIMALRLIFAHHPSKYETIAKDVTVALQKNDVEGVKRWQNAETATHVTASRVGRGADALAPLGAYKNIKETSTDADTRTHQFDLTFDKGTLHETIKFDPDDKIVTFHYDEPNLTK